jgi:hypothetical protein
LFLCRKGVKEQTVNHIYTPEEIRFLKENVPGRSYAEVTALFNELFGLKLNKQKIINMCHRLGVKNGLISKFKPGHIAYNKGAKGLHHAKHRQRCPIGTEKIDYYGYTLVETADSVWEAKHRYIWEQAHGKIPKGMKIIFLDNNRQNFDLENLAMVSISEGVRLTQYGLRSNNREETLTGIAIVRHALAIHNRLKKMLGTKEHRKFVKERSKRLHN